jgi:hypothetical protein
MTKKDIRIGLLIDGKTNELLLAEQRKTGAAVAEIIRRAIAAYLTGKEGK